MSNAKKTRMVALAVPTAIEPRPVAARGRAAHRATDDLTAWDDNDDAALVVRERLDVEYLGRLATVLERLERLEHRNARLAGLRSLPARLLGRVWTHWPRMPARVIPFCVGAFLLCKIVSVPTAVEPVVGVAIGAGIGTMLWKRGGETDGDLSVPGADGQDIQRARVGDSVQPHGRAGLPLPGYDADLGAQRVGRRDLGRRDDRLRRGVRAPRSYPRRRRGAHR